MMSLHICLHFFTNLTIHFTWYLNGGINRVNKTDLGSNTLRHVFTIVRKFINEQSPFAYRDILVIVQTSFSMYNLTKVNLPKGNFLVMVLVIETNHFLVDLTLIIKLVYKGSLITGWCQS